MTAPSVGLFGGNAGHYEDPLASQLAGRASVHRFQDATALVAALPTLDILISPVFAPAWRASRLRLLNATGAGVDKIALDALPANCAACATPGHEVPIAEYVMHALLELTLSARALTAAFALGRREGGAFGPGHLHDELFGKTLCLLGFGRVGREIAARARAFGMTIGAVCRSDPTEFVNWRLPPSELATAVARCDALVIACPLTVETRHLVDARILSALAPHAVLINIARAEIVAEAPLYEALAQRRIAGAALDVWYADPPGDGSAWRGSAYDFAELPHVLCTPHASAWSTGLWRRRVAFVLENVERVLAGREPRGRVARGALET